MYIPILKNRLYENKFIRDYSYLFGGDVLPMIEIIENKIGRTKKSIYEIIENYHETLDCEFFIDLFTFSANMYKPYSPTSVSYAVNLRENYTDYMQDLEEFKFFVRAIPVISVKEDRDFEVFDIENLIVDLKETNDKIAVRLESNYFEEFSKILIPYLDEEDYLMLDINEDDISSKFMEMEYFQETDFPCKTVIVCSPRHRKIKNGLYTDQSFTNLIDFEVLNKYKDYGFGGYSDYANLKDVLPSDRGNGKGAALGIFFLKSKNKVYSIMNSNTDEGTKGHRHVIDRLMEASTRDLLDPNRDCLMYEFIEDNMIPFGKTGSWGQWKYITLIRTISEIKK